MKDRSTAGHAPVRALPLLYLGTAHVSLALACGLAGLWPQAVAGFFYHAWLVGLVHLVTLGWITFSILGAIFIVGPLALRMAMPATRADHAAYALAVVGLIGMEGHFWIREYGGMAWSAAAVASAVAFMTVRIAVRVRRARIPAAVKAHVLLACVNFWIAAAMGVLIAWDKVGHFLPGFVLSNVFAHAHLAALGWATMMVVGVGYRLLPMTFPSQMPRGRSVYASAVLLEIGVIGLFVSLLCGSRWALAAGGAIVAGLIVFGAHVVWMTMRPVSRPVGARQPDFGLLHAGSAGLWLIASAVLGTWLLATPTSSLTLHVAAAYGVFGLLGFLAQMVVAMEARLVPMVSWFWSYERSGYLVPPPSPHVMRDRQLQGLVFAGWLIGVPALAAGLALESARVVGMGAWSLFVAVAVATLDNVLVVLPAVRGQRQRVNRDSASAVSPHSSDRSVPSVLP